MPGSKGTLAQQRAREGDIRPVYDPSTPAHRQETRKNRGLLRHRFRDLHPMTAALLAARKQGIENLCFISTMCWCPAIHAVMADGVAKVNAFIGLPRQASSPAPISTLPIVGVIRCRWW